MANLIADRKLIELEQKLSRLDDEFDYWLAQSNPGAPFEKNHTQIRTIKKRLDGLNSKIRGILPGKDNPEKILSLGQNIQQMILAVHRIWEYFRSKFVQRREKLFVDYLR